MSAETKYCRFTDDDNDVWASYNPNSGNVKVLEKVWYFRGGAMRNELQRQQIIGEILKENGVTINMTESCGDPVDYSAEDPRFAFLPTDSASLDGSIYKYFVMLDEGRGWGVILRKTPDDQVELLASDHVDNITDEMIKMAQKIGIGFTTKYTYDEDIEDLDSFEPSPKDF